MSQNEIFEQAEDVPSVESVAFVEVDPVVDELVLIMADSAIGSRSSDHHTGVAPITRSEYEEVLLAYKPRAAEKKGTVDAFGVFRRALLTAFPARSVVASQYWLELSVNEREYWGCRATIEQDMLIRGEHKTGTVKIPRKVETAKWKVSRKRKAGQASASEAALSPDTQMRKAEMTGTKMKVRAAHAMAARIRPAAVRTWIVDGPHHHSEPEIPSEYMELLKEYEQEPVLRSEYTGLLKEFEQEQRNKHSHDDRMQVD